MPSVSARCSTRSATSGSSASRAPRTSRLAARSAASLTRAGSSPPMISAKNSAPGFIGRWCWRSDTPPKLRVRPHRHRPNRQLRRGLDDRADPGHLLVECGTLPAGQAAQRLDGDDHPLARTASGARRRRPRRRAAAPGSCRPGRPPAPARRPGPGTAARAAASRPGRRRSTAAAAPPAPRTRRTRCRRPTPTPALRRARPPRGRRARRAGWSTPATWPASGPGAPAWPGRTPPGRRGAAPAAPGPGPGSARSVSQRLGLA